MQKYFLIVLILIAGYSWSQIATDTPTPTVTNTPTPTSIFTSSPTFTGTLPNTPTITPTLDLSLLTQTPIGITSTPKLVGGGAHINEEYLVDGLVSSCTSEEFIWEDTSPADYMLIELPERYLVQAVEVYHHVINGVTNCSSVKELNTQAMMIYVGEEANPYNSKSLATFNNYYYGYAEEYTDHNSVVASTARAGRYIFIYFVKPNWLDTLGVPSTEPDTKIVREYEFKFYGYPTARATFTGTPTGKPNTPTPTGTWFTPTPKNTSTPVPTKNRAAWITGEIQLGQRKIKVRPEKDMNYIPTAQRFGLIWPEPLTIFYYMFKNAYCFDWIFDYMGATGNKIENTNGERFIRLSSVDLFPESTEEGTPTPTPITHYIYNKITLDANAAARYAKGIQVSVGGGKDINYAFYGWADPAVENYSFYGAKGKIYSADGFQSDSDFIISGDINVTGSVIASATVQGATGIFGTGTTQIDDNVNTNIITCTTGNFSINVIDDVNVPNPNDGDLFTFNKSTSKWEAAALDAHQAVQELPVTDALTTSTVYVDLIKKTLTTGNSPVLILFSGEFKIDTANKVIVIRVEINGSGRIESQRAVRFDAANSEKEITTSWLEVLPAGSNTITIQWKVPEGGTGTAVNTNRALQIIELK